MLTLLVYQGISLLLWQAQDLEIPTELKSLYKTVWEIKQRVLVDMAADRGAFIDQSQSFNVHMSDPNFGKLTSLHFYAWKVSLSVHHVTFHPQLLRSLAAHTDAWLQPAPHSS